MTKTRNMSFSTGVKMQVLHEDGCSYCQIATRCGSRALFNRQRAQHWIIQQINAPCHVTRASKTWMNEHGVQLLDWTAESPDTSSKENLWHILKAAVSERGFLREMTALFYFVGRQRLKGARTSNVVRREKILIPKLSGASYQERVLCTSPRNTKPRRVREGQDMRKNKLEKGRELSRSPEQELEYVVQGLIPYIQQQVLFKEPSTLSDVKRIALLVESMTPTVTECSLALVRSASECTSALLIMKITIRKLSDVKYLSFITTHFLQSNVQKPGHVVATKGVRQVGKITSRELGATVTFMWNENRRELHTTDIHISPVKNAIGANGWCTTTISQPRTRKTKSATILTSSPFKPHLESRQEGKGKSTGKGKWKHPAKKRVAHAKKSKKVDESSDEEEWPCLVCEPFIQPVMMQIPKPKAAQNEPVPLGAMLTKGAGRDNLPPVARALALHEFKMASHVKT
ncbi:hypothetical protein LSH36_449g01019 [Paralvinella palmiformis]|uniref:Uncharacterized protein n=1 Tax=Paralvinella palmiformis TaxID=53620 RepID=A0AAD9JB26_9ANNE|nr:hypothetical protein LSH36_449g01019 [Paralvinella palmiformis]